ncbi:hypothetical protein IWQ61_001050 [Dispira simplex]|nr:hypothetical protein IWQ61_001050 [Dispira simplex]
MLAIPRPSFPLAYWGLTSTCSTRPITLRTTTHSTRLLLTLPIHRVKPTTSHAWLHTTGTTRTSLTSKLVSNLENLPEDFLEPEPPGDPELTIKRFRALGLTQDVANLVGEQTSWCAPTTVQNRMIPTILRGHNVVASAWTGQGKTAAFGLPIVDAIYRNKNTPDPAEIDTGRDPNLTARVPNFLSRPLVASPRALILTPSYDLASQVREDIDLFGSALGVNSVILSNESSFEFQLQRLDPTVDVVVGTPGRILSHVRLSRERLQSKSNGDMELVQPCLDVSRLQYLVLDECDRLFSLGFLPDVFELWKLLPRPNRGRQRQGLQTVVTSATIIPEVHNFVLRVAPVHELHHLNEKMTIPRTITQLVYEVHKQRKFALLIYFLRRSGNVSLRDGKILVFTRTIERCNKLATYLCENGYAAAPLNSDCTNAQRKETLKNFILGHLKIVVATDIATRGMDIPGLTHVVNMDVPHNVEDYIHRVGRTGRAGEVGMALTLVSKETEEFYLKDHQLVKRDERALMAQIEKVVGSYRDTKSGIQRRKIPGPWLDENKVWLQKHLDRLDRRNQHRSEEIQAAKAEPISSTRSTSTEHRGKAQSGRTLTERFPDQPVRNFDQVVDEYDRKNALRRGLDPKLLIKQRKVLLSTKFSRKHMEKQKTGQ